MDKPRIKGTKAHWGALVTAAAACVAQYLSGNLEADTIRSLGEAAALAAVAWGGIYVAPANKEKE